MSIRILEIDTGRAGPRTVGRRARTGRGPKIGVKRALCLALSIDGFELDQSNNYTIVR